MEVQDSNKKLYHNIVNTQFISPLLLNPATSELSLEFCERVNIVQLS